MKTITICDKEYPIDCNAFTYVMYKKKFKTGIFEDIQKIQIFTTIQSINQEKIKKENPDITEEELEEKLGQLMIKNGIDEFVVAITQITWILLHSANENIEEYDKWLKSIKKFSVNDKWIVEVTKFVVSCFC